MRDDTLQHYLREFRSGHDVAPTETESLLDALVSGTDETLLARVLNAWNIKGTIADELFGFASLMRTRMKRINSRYESFVDVVGTGGSNAKTFNVSTAAAFVIAAADVPLAKHDNRAATINSGSADVLALLDINVE